MKAIMYHYVRKGNPEMPHFRHLDFDDFRKQLDHFQATYRFVSQAELMGAISSGEPVKGGIVLTFDDALDDHYRYVFPELKQRGLWGIFYVPAAPYLFDKILDVHRIHLLLGKCGGEKILRALQGIISDDMLTDSGVSEFRMMTYSAQNNDAATDQVKRTLNYYISYEYRERVIDKLMGQFFVPGKISADIFYMSKQAIKEMHEAGMVIGSHAINHLVMSKLTPDEQQEEITRSFGLLNDFVGELPIKTFCYPYGGFYSFTDDTERMLEEAGCHFSFNVEHRDIEQKDLSARRQALPRWDCNLFPYGKAK